MKRYALVIAFAIVIIVGLFLFRGDRSSEADFESSEAEDIPVLHLDEEEEKQQDDTPVDDVATNVMVDIKGAVNNPGVYELDIGTRVVDLIELADGFTSDALDTEINLAQKLEDEMVIYVPKQGEDVQEAQWDKTGNSEESSANKVKINEASEEELVALSGIGPAKAQAIISYRDEHGPFQEIDDLLEISSIGEKTLEQFKEMVDVP